MQTFTPSPEVQQIAAKSHAARSNKALGAVALSVLAAAIPFLTGCGAGMRPSAQAAAGVTLSGHLQGGQQAVSGSKIYLYAVSATGYATTATSLLSTPGYVTTDSNGNFNITNDYTCPAGAYVYALALGGNPGLTAGTNNAKLALMSGIGLCSNLVPTSFISINEVTTVAAAYALAPFAASETAIGTSSTNVTGLKNAFASITNLVGGTGNALLKTPAGNGTSPQAAIDTLANVLAACVNSDGTGTACTSLMTAANVTTTPADTVQAALNIAQHPGVNVAALYNLSAANAPFQPALTTAPNDWTMQITYTGTINQIQGIAIDAAGNVYAGNSQGASVTEFSPSGTQLAVLTSPTLYRPQEIGIDLAGNIWSISRANTNVTPNTAASMIEWSSNGTLLSGTTGYTGGGLSTPRGLAIDPRGNIWASGNGELSEFTSTGVAVSSNTGYTSSLLYPYSFEMSFDTLGNAWTVSTDGNANSTLLEFTPVSASFNAGGIYGGTPKQVGAGTVAYPIGVAIDASNNVWVANAYGGTSGTPNGTGSVGEYSNAGTEISPTYGYTDGGTLQPQTLVIDGLGNVFTSQSQVAVRTRAGVAVTGTNGYQTVNNNDCCLAAAIDGSGNFWTGGVGFLYQWVGLAAPVVTPKVKGVVNSTLATRP